MLSRVPRASTVGGILERHGAATEKHAMEILGWKAVRPDLTTDGNGAGKLTRWYPGTTVTAPSPDPLNTGPCPTAPGDGLCLARTIAAARYVGPLQTVVLVAYDEADVLGADDEKLRVISARVLDVWDAQRLIRRAGKADLSEAYLSEAYLSEANLSEANLSRADLSRANLSEANLREADLSRANLSEANLSRADLGPWERGPDGYARRRTP